MKPEISAATEFLSRVFLAHDRISKEKIADFKKHLAALLEERFVNHWHEASPTKGQAFRCIRVCPEEALDPILEKVCQEVGISTGDFQLPIELTLWVDPTEVVCKFGDLKCSYHTVAKKDENSGTLDNQALELDIEDLVENARELYLKKQSVVIHPINSSEMHIPYSDGSTNGFTMAIRMNGTVHYNMLALNGANGGNGISNGYDGSPRSKNRSSHSMHHKRAGSGFHYYGKSSGGKGSSHYLSNGSVATSSSSSSGSHQSYPHHRSNHHHHHDHHNHHHHHHHQHHHHHGSQHHHQHTMGSSPYSNSYLNGYVDESGANNGNGYVFDQRSTSPTKMNGMSHPPPSLGCSSNNGTGTQSSPTPEQIQQQMLHPPPMPPHLQQAFVAGHPPGPDTSTLPPPPPLSSSSSSSAAVSSSSSTAVTSNITSNSSGTSSIMASPSGKPTNNSKYPNNRSGGMGGPRNKQGSPAKEMK
ncbi:protein btg3 [Plakobranchus ocellatus]|uniref:Protein btg3 n=1 Tax=Plakobranchus ocellatus TaxID=259542 RepID=A0AAV4CDG3_9GAST|nr:protein btg3 [Plakobranchus ocellatus]